MSTRAVGGKDRQGIEGRWRALVVLGLFTLVGINLRTVILGVPPVLPLIKHDLGLTYTATGMLTSLPILVMAAAAWPAGTLAGRMGARRSVVLGLSLLALGTLLRAAWLAAAPLFVFTLLLSLGVAIGQTAMPVLARQWFPTQIGLAAALFTDGLITGETIAAGLTVPIMMNLLGRDAWPATFVVWGVPVVVVLALWLWLAPAAPGLNRTLVRRGTEDTDRAAVAQSNTPVARRARVRSWHLGILLGAASLIFFSMNGWIATYNQAVHRSALTSPALLVLNAAQLPVSFGMTPFAQQLSGRRWPFVAAGVICIIAISGWLLTLHGGSSPMDAQANRLIG